MNPRHPVGDASTVAPGIGSATDSISASKRQSPGRQRMAKVNALGAAPLLALVAALGLLLIASADNGSRLGETGSETLFWAGLLLIYLPIALRLFGSSASSSERLALVVVLGVSLYLVKVVHSPAGFTLHDELASWRGAWDLLESGHLFADNPLVGGYSVFPGMTAVTAALAQLSGLSIFISALILIGARAHDPDDRALPHPRARLGLGPGRRHRDRGVCLQPEHPLLRLPVRL